MNILDNILILPLGLVTATIALLGFIVFFNDYKSVTNRSFLAFSLAAILWNSSNFLAYYFDSLSLVTWLLRLNLFFAVWYSFSLFYFFLMYPHTKYPGKKRFRIISFLWTAIVSILVLTPVAITKIQKLPSDTTTTNKEDVLGLGMAVFGFTVFSLIIGGIFIFLRKYHTAPKEEKKKYAYILFGTLVTFCCYLVFNFLFPVFLNNVRLIPYGAFYTFPVVIFAGYAIIKHRLINVKVLSSEILVFMLLIGIVFEILISSSALTLFFRTSLFFLVLGVGLLLIRSVIKEVKQREELQILTKKLEEANKQLQALDKARSDFITIASHQLRTPPATIKWYLGAILSGDYGAVPKDISEQLQKAQVTNNSLISLIDDMLNASRIERGKMEFLFEETDVVAITKLTYEQLVPQATIKKLQLLYHPPDGTIPQVMADKEKLRQVINNFIDNAIKYTKEGSVSVGVSADSEQVTVRVTDTGKGMTEQEQKNLFEKYTRGKDAMTHSSGLGLGLYVAKIIIEQHKGKIWADSPGEGKGSTFACSIPIHSTVPKNTVFNLAAQ
jgi:signal transduction histidine kinase